MHRNPTLLRRASAVFASLVAVIAFLAVLAPASPNAVAVISRVQQQTFAEDRISSPADVDESQKVHDPIPSDTAITLEWYKEHLESDEKQELYETMKAAVFGLRRGVRVNGLSLSDVNECFWALRYDHPEVFWIDTFYTYHHNGDQVISFDFTYLVDDKETIESKWRDYELVSDAVIIGTENPDSKRCVMRQIYEWVGRSTSYEEGDNDQNMSSVFEQRKSVCAGYVQALQFMALRAGIPCARIYGHGLESDGSTSEGNHTWLGAVAGYSLTFYDVTWDALSHAVELDAYYSVKQKDFEKTHVFASDKAPQNIGERDDSEELVELAFNTSTGLHLSYTPLPDVMKGWDDESIDALVNMLSDLQYVSNHKQSIFF